jgi:hypothetical protein
LNASVGLIGYLFPDVLDVVEGHLGFESDVVSVGEVKMMFNELGLVEDVFVGDAVVVVKPRGLRIVDVINGRTRTHEPAGREVQALDREVAPAADRTTDLGGVGSAPALATEVQGGASG